MFGIKNKELQENYISIKNLIDNYSASASKYKQDADKAQKELMGKLSSLEEKLGEQSAKSSEAINSLSKKLDEAERKLAGYEEKISALESDKKSSGIVSGIISKKGEITYSELKGLAADISDKAYQKILGYFMLEYAKLGYEGKVSGSGWWASLKVKDATSGIETQLTSDNSEGVPTSYTLAKATLDNYDMTSGVLELGYHQAFYAKGPRSGFIQKFVQDTPQVVKSYMLGYAMHCVEHGEHWKAVKIQKEFGLMDSPALLDKMAEVMQNDPKLADQFMLYCRKGGDSDGK